jgi:hypothetical protein
LQYTSIVPPAGDAILNVPVDPAPAQLVRKPCDGPNAASAEQTASVVAVDGTTTNVDVGHTVTCRRARAVAARQPISSTATKSANMTRVTAPNHNGSGIESECRNSKSFFSCLSSGKNAHPPPPHQPRCHTEERHTEASTKERHNEHAPCGVVA